MLWWTRRQLSSSDPATRAQAVTKLAAMRDVESVPDLIWRLDDPSLEVRLACLKALLELRDLATSDLVLLLGDDDYGEHAARVLGEMGSDAVPAILTAITSREPMARLRAVRLIDGRRSAEILRALGVAILDASREVRHAAAAAISGFGEDAIEPLALALGDPRKDVQSEASAMLAVIGSPRAVPLLLPLLKHSDWTIRLQVVESLGELGVPAAVGPLIELFEDRDASVRRGAVIALAEIGDRRGGASLPAMLHDEDDMVRKATRKAMARFGLTVPTGDADVS